MLFSFPSNKLTSWIILTLIFLLLSPALSSAQRNLRNIPDPDPELELRELQVAEGFEINLYAADPLLAKPIQMNFDSEGRLWVASSELYPQISPGQIANDKVLVLEDVDGDGRADKTRVFADGLHIPTGVLPGDGGAYVANSTELLHLSDTDGDGRADRSRVMLSGFGTEDTHHILHTLRWGPDGMLYMNQSIYIHSHIETPYGVRRMNGAGIWHYRPETMQLEIFTQGLVNPWGHHFDRFGQSFETDGAGGEGINFVFPGFVGITSPGAKRVLHGLNPGSPKYCGLERISGRHIPPEWQGSLLTNDFRAHRVCRFVVSEDGSGFASREQQELIKSKHAAFRPIDIKMGPDGAIYIADWYNPIIQHGEVDFRDPRRDHVHGRIWRVTALGRPLVPRPKLVDASIEELLDNLRAPEQWTRLQAKRVLKERGRKQVLPALAAWTSLLDSEDPRLEHLRLETLWIYQSLDVVNEELLRTLLQAKDHRIRAAATRVIYHWHTRLTDPLSLLTFQVEDSHPRVRLEAVRALSRLSVPQACEAAMRALDHPKDRFLDFAIWSTARDLKNVWLPALQTGQIDFSGNSRHLTYALQAIESPQVVPLLLDRLKQTELDADRLEAVLSTLAALGSPEDYRQILNISFDAATPITRRVQLLRVLADSSLRRKIQPAGDLSPMAKILEEENIALVSACLAAAGVWKLEGLRPMITQIAKNSQASSDIRREAMMSLAGLGGSRSKKTLIELGKQTENRVLRMAAISQLVVIDVNSAAQQAAELLVDLSPEYAPHEMIAAFLSRQLGAQALAKSIKGKKISPDVAKLALRTIRSSGTQQAALEAAVSEAGGLQSTEKSYTPDDIAKLIDDVQSDGNADRGQIVFRRRELACMKCHAIGGAGGRVGADLVSIGASAQVDYLIESILEPNKKIKENYHSLSVLTEAGKLITGVKVRQTDKELLLRDAEDRDLRIPLESIVDQKDGGSLMPKGLIDSLTRQEFVDLVRFLSELGKIGPYSIGNRQFVRRWQMLDNTPGNRTRIRNSDLNSVLTDEDELQWNSVYSLVSGEIPLEDLVQIKARGLEKSSLVRFQIDVTTSGKIQLNWNSIDSLQSWLDSKSVKMEKQQTLDLTTGTHTIAVSIDLNTRRQPLRVELVEAADSKARAQIVTGK